MHQIFIIVMAEIKSVNLFPFKSKQIKQMLLHFLTMLKSSRHCFHLLERHGDFINEFTLQENQYTLEE